MKSFTEKPCPGCSKVLPLPPNTVCSACSTAIHEYPTARALLAGTDTTKIRNFLLGERAAIPSAMYGYKSAEPFAKAVSELLRCVGNGTVNENPSKDIYHNPSRITYSHYGVAECQHLDIQRQDYEIHLPSEAQDYLSKLYQAMAEAVKEAEAIGQAKGQNLLFQLNSGALSCKDFDDQLSKVNVDE